MNRPATGNARGRRQQPRTGKSGGDIPGLPARRAAMRLLDAVLRQGLPLEAVMERATAGIDRADDRAFAHAIAGHVLRRLVDLDALIDSATQQVLPDDAKARFALRIALVQALLLGTPPHAVVATTLPLLEGGPRRLVHGVFGALMRRGATLPDQPTLPEGAAMRWHEAWGDAMTDAASAALATPPPVDLALAVPGETSAWAERLGAHSAMPGHVRLPVDAGPVTALPGFADGAWWVQDLSAQLPARLVGAPPAKGARLLDLCAAPGGKTMQLAAAGWRVMAVDQSESRLARLADNLARTGLAAEVVMADLLSWSPPEVAEAVLLDAPCSATGIYRRHPDVLHRVHDADIAAMAALQAKLLARAAGWVCPGGVLVYATCSLEPAEGEAQVEAFLARNPGFALVPPPEGALPPGLSGHERGWVRTLPDQMAALGGGDGFFMARMMRSG